MLIKNRGICTNCEYGWKYFKKEQINKDIEITYEMCRCNCHDYDYFGKSLVHYICPSFKERKKT